MTKERAKWIDVDPKDRKEQIDYLNKAAETIFGAFVFDNTPEGHAYWWGVYEKLQAMANEAAE